MREENVPRIVNFASIDFLRGDKKWTDKFSIWNVQIQLLPDKSPSREASLAQFLAEVQRRFSPWLWAGGLLTDEQELKLTVVVFFHWLLACCSRDYSCRILMLNGPNCSVVCYSRLFATGLSVALFIQKLI